MAGQVRLATPGPIGPNAWRSSRRRPGDVLERAYDDASSAGHREGISAFLEKRPPRF